MPNSSWTETGASISLVPVTTPINTGSDPENVNYLSNQDKINLMAQYSAELAMKTTLDTAAAGLNVSSANYDNAVAAISTGLIAAGAPANWATIWPDGTTSGPWPNIQADLATWWSNVATQRTALQTDISSAQAAAAQEAAILAAQPHQVSWASTNLPALPSASYPAGYYAITTDNLTYQVDMAGTAWLPVLYSAAGLFGEITAGQIAAGAITADMITTGTLNGSDVNITNLNASNITTGTIAASKVSFPDGSVLTSAGVQMYQLGATPGGPYAVPTTWTQIPGMSTNVTANSANDTFNLFLSFDCEATATLPTNLQISIALMIDGTQKTIKNFYPTLPSGQSATFPWFTTFTGLSAGNHTIALYYSANFSPSNLSMFGDTNALIQRIF